MALADAVGDHLEPGKAQVLGLENRLVFLRVCQSWLELEKAAHADGELALVLKLLEDAQVFLFGNATVGPDAARRGDAKREGLVDGLPEGAVHVCGHVRKAPNRVVDRRFLANARGHTVLVAYDDAAIWVHGVLVVACNFECLAVHPADVHVPRCKVRGAVGDDLIEHVARGLFGP